MAGSYQDRNKVEQLFHLTVTGRKFARHRGKSASNPSATKTFPSGLRLSKLPFRDRFAAHCHQIGINLKEPLPIQHFGRFCEGIHTVLGIKKSELAGEVLDAVRKDPRTDMDPRLKSYALFAIMGESLVSRIQTKLSPETLYGLDIHHLADYCMANMHISTPEFFAIHLSAEMMSRRLGRPSVQAYRDHFAKLDIASLMIAIRMSTVATARAVTMVWTEDLLAGRLGDRDIARAHGALQELFRTYPHHNLALTRNLRLNLPLGAGNGFETQSRGFAIPLSLLDVCGELRRGSVTEERLKSLTVPCLFSAQHRAGLHERVFRTIEGTLSNASTTTLDLEYKPRAFALCSVEGGEHVAISTYGMENIIAQMEYLEAHHLIQGDRIGCPFRAISGFEQPRAISGIRNIFGWIGEKVVWPAVTARAQRGGFC